MKNKIKVIIVDDHKMFREILLAILSNVEGIEVVGEATNGMEFLSMLELLKANVVLMDIMMPGMNGLEALGLALEKYPDLKIIVLSMLCDIEFYDRLIEAGVSGYILKDSGKDELFRAIRTVAKGDKYFSQKLIHKLVLSSKDVGSDESYSDKPAVSLNITEKLILRMICMGKTNAEISNELLISQRTLENYKSIMIHKMGVKDSLGLAIYAVRNKLIDIKE